MQVESRRFGWYRRYETVGVLDRPLATMVKGVREEEEMPVEPITEVKVEPKPGYKTTEFWLAVGTAIAGFTAEIAQLVPEKLGIALATASTILYTVTRALLKK